VNVKIARIKKGLTQKQLRVMLKISPAKMVAIEKGEYDKLSLGLMKKIAKMLNTTIQELFFVF